MKSNLKGGNGVVRFLLAHGEKIGMVAVLACAFLLLWSAMGVPRMEQGKDPGTLTNHASAAEQHVNSFTYDTIAESDPAAVIDSVEIDLASMKAVEPEHFPNINPHNPYIVQPQKSRTDPELLTAEDLEVRADLGLWATANPEMIKQRQLEALAEQQKAKAEAEAREARARDEDQGGEGRGRGRRGRDEREPEVRPRGPNSTIVLQPGTGVELQGFEEIHAQSWVTVLARVPIKAQNRLYEDALQSARGYQPQRDMPTYLGYLIERAEVTPEGQGEWKKLALVNKGVLIKELATYPVNPQEVVASKYVHPVLTHPLPPLILKEWDDRASHSSIPLAIDEEAALMEAEMAPVEEEPAADDADGEDDMGFGRTAPRAGEVPPGGYMERGGYGREAGRGMYDGGGGEGYGRGGGGMDGGEGYGRGGGGGYGRGGSMGAGSGVELAEFSWDGKTSDVLLRFFDNTVQPGHRYRYRVKLALQDVNDGVQVKDLDKTVTARRKEIKTPSMRSFRLTEWSKPSPIASVPLPARLYVMAAEPAKESAYNSQPDAELLIKALNSSLAAEIALAESFTRGSVMNLRKAAKVVWSNQYNVDKDPEFDFTTGATLVDIQGGDKLSSKNRDLLAPARVVLMDAAGKLTIKEELKDLPTVKEYKAILESPPDERGGGYGGEGNSGRGGGGRGGGGRGRGGF